MTEPDVSKWTDAVLAETIEEFKAESELYRKHIAANDKIIRELESERDRRVIQTFPFKAGDKILVTPDMFPKYARYLVGSHETFEAVIEEIASFEGKEIKVWIGRGGISIEDATTMRTAYLRAHESEDTR